MCKVSWKSFDFRLVLECSFAFTHTVLNSAPTHGRAYMKDNQKLVDLHVNCSGHLDNMVVLKHLWEPQYNMLLFLGNF